ncbi:MAG: hypothetical protein Q4P24_18480, partial [Rhodobacterales bacterium]|nr:hypothetical protein [Rhodobacterales bacterium]
MFLHMASGRYVGDGKLFAKIYKILVKTGLTFFGQLPLPKPSRSNKHDQKFSCQAMASDDVPARRRHLCGQGGSVRL